MINKIWTFWTGDNPITPNRLAGLKSMKVLGVEVMLVSKRNLNDLLVPGFPLHPAYEFLSEVHKSDYLRCYFLYHYGGGYADIKTYHESWIPYFDRFESDPNLQVIGTRDTSEGVFEYALRPHADKLIQCGYYIMRDHCEFTQKWIDRLHETLDKFYDELKLHPATQIRDRKDQEFTNPDGTKYISQYPLRWGKILGSIIHPLCYEFSQTNPSAINFDLPPADLNIDYL